MMNVYRKLRFYHAMLAFSALAAYATGESGIVHAWIGYALVGIILFRLAWGMFGPSQFRIGRFLPDLASLLRIRAANDPAIARVLLGGVVASLLLVVGTGIALDQAKSLNVVAEARTVPVPRFEFRTHEISMTRGATTPNTGRDDDDEKEDWLRELHEFSANLMLLFVGLHVSYMILLRRPLAMFMLFVPGQKQRTA
jgi:cytochrome b